MMALIQTNATRPIGWVALCFLLCIGGSFLGASLRSSPTGKLLLRVEPQQLSVGDACLEHTPITLHLMLLNEFHVPFEVREVHLSCGCMALTSGEDQTITAGTIVDAHKAIPLTITINPENRNGPQTYLVQFRGRVDGHVVETRGEIHMSVRPSWRASPPEVVFQPTEVCDELTAEVKVFDGYPGDGILLDQIEASSSTRITTEIVPSSSADSHENPNDLLRERFTVRVTYRPTDPYESASDFITLRPVDGRLGTKRVPVRFLGILPAIQLSPPELILRQTDLLDRAIKRTIICRVRESREEPRVVRQPRDVQVEVSRVSPDTWQLRTVISPTIKMVVDEPLELGLEVGDKKYSVPIRITQL